MKRCGLLLAAGGAVLLAAAVCHRLSRAPRPLPSAPTAPSSAPEGPKESTTGDEAWRYRLCQPRHWRYVLLNQ